MVRQWNSLSLDCVTVRSTISRSLFARSQRVTCSPRSSRSLALVAENTFTPVNIPPPPSGLSLAKRSFHPRFAMSHGGLAARRTRPHRLRGAHAPGGGMATGRGGDARRKRELAVEFIRQIRAMERDKLHALILREAGEELAQFFLAYATDLMEREPGRAVENASSLLLIGYLIRAFEVDRSAPEAEVRPAFRH